MEVLSSLTLILPIFLIWYFLIIRPQNKEREAHDALVESLTKDDEVVLASGLHGKVVGVDESTLVLELAKNVRVTVDKHHVQRKKGADTAQ